MITHFYATSIPEYEISFVPAGAEPQLSDEFLEELFEIGVAVLLSVAKKEGPTHRCVAYVRAASKTSCPDGIADFAPRSEFGLALADYLGEGSLGK